MCVCAPGRHVTHMSGHIRQGHSHAGAVVRGVSAVQACGTCSGFCLLTGLVLSFSNLPTYPSPPTGVLGDHVFPTVLCAVGDQRCCPPVDGAWLRTGAGAGMVLVCVSSGAHCIPCCRGRCEGRQLAACIMLRGVAHFVHVEHRLVQARVGVGGWVGTPVVAGPWAPVYGCHTHAAAAHGLVTL